MCIVATIYAGEKPGIMRDYLHFFVNGQECQVRGAEAFQPLSSYLRNKLGLTGTKVVCEEGDCGACTVLAGRLKDGTIDYKPINSCIHYVFQADLSHIITIEGLKNQGKLNAVQESMVAHHGAQCGGQCPRCQHLLGRGVVLARRREWQWCRCHRGVNPFLILWSNPNQSSVASRGGRHSSRSLRPWRSLFDRALVLARRGKRRWRERRNLGGRAGR